MKAPIAQAGGEAASPPGFAFIFFLGPRNRKMHLQKLGFRRGSDLSTLSKIEVLVRQNMISTWRNGRKNRTKRSGFISHVIRSV
jgi:hypothetical protein